jgi:hypothetical protein
VFLSPPFNPQGGRIFRINIILLTFCQKNHLYWACPHYAILTDNWELDDIFQEFICRRWFIHLEQTIYHLGKERNSDGWVTLLHAGHNVGIMCFPFFYRVFLPQHKYCMLLVGNKVLWKHQCKSLHFKSTRADVHYASASFGTTPPTYITLPYPGFQPGTFGFQYGVQNTAKSQY